jgi:hypothetical protein
MPKTRKARRTRRRRGGGQGTSRLRTNVSAPVYVDKNDLSANLSENEYKRLTSAQKAFGWVEYREPIDRFETETRYRRRTPENDRRDLEATLNWRVAHNPDIQLTESEYGALTPEQKALGWIKFSERVQWEDETRYRRRTAENDRRNLESTLEWRLEHKPEEVALTESEYKALTPAQKALGWVESMDGRSHWADDPTKLYRPVPKKR